MFSFKFIFCCVLLKSPYLWSYDVHFLVPGVTWYYSKHIHDVTYKIYCYEPMEKTIFALWRVVKVNVSLNNFDYLYFVGNSTNSLREEYGKRNWPSINNLVPNVKIRWYLNPFEETCVGIATADNYYISFETDAMNAVLFTMFVSGLVFFLLAEQLSSNQYFHYVAGITAGIVVFFLLALYFMAKQIRKTFYLYTLLVSSWFVGLYIVKMIIDNLQFFIGSYLKYILIYILVTGFISFILCYRFGPVTDSRSRKILKWILLMVGILLIYNSTYLYEVAFLFIVILIAFRVIPVTPIYWLFRKIVNVLKRKKYNPPVPKYLTTEQYRLQCIRETSKSLEDLRAYFTNFDANHWRLMSRLRHPIKFLEFIETGLDVTDAERIAFNEENISEESDD